MTETNSRSGAKTGVPFLRVLQACASVFKVMVDAIHVASRESNTPSFSLVASRTLHRFGVECVYPPQHVFGGTFVYIYIYKYSKSTQTHVGCRRESRLPWLSTGPRLT